MKRRPIERARATSINQQSDTSNGVEGALIGLFTRLSLRPIDGRELEIGNLGRRPDWITSRNTGWTNPTR